MGEGCRGSTLPILPPVDLNNPTGRSHLFNVQRGATASGSASPKSFYLIQLDRFRLQIWDVQYVTVLNHQPLS